MVSSGADVTITEGMSGQVSCMSTGIPVSEHHLENRQPDNELLPNRHHHRRIFRDEEKCNHWHTERKHRPLSLYIEKRPVPYSSWYIRMHSSKH